MRLEVNIENIQDNDDDRAAVERFNKNHPWRINTKGLSSLEILNKMQDRICLAKWTDNGMQGLLYELEDMINDCYMQIKKEHNLTNPPHIR